MNKKPAGLFGLIITIALTLIPSSLAVFIIPSNSSISIFHPSSLKWYPYYLILFNDKLAEYNGYYGTGIIKPEFGAANNYIQSLIALLAPFAKYIFSGSVS